MSRSHRTFLAYGTRIPDIDPDTLEAALADHATVTYLLAGDDHNMTFLAITSTLAAVKPGTYRSIAPQVELGTKCHAWNHELRTAATALGIHDVPMPAWLVIPDLS